MRVLLVISDYKAGFPYIQDLERELKAKKVFVDILDVENLYLIGNDGVVKNISRSELLKKLLKLPLIRTYVRIFLLKRLLKSKKSKSIMILSFYGISYKTRGLIIFILLLFTK